MVFGEQLQGFDEFDTVVGKQYWFILQANYIESLVDDRLFRQLPDWINITVGIVMLLGFEFILWIFDANALQTAALGGIFIVFVLLIAYLVVNLAGFYPDLGFGVLSIIGSRVVDFFMPPVPARHAKKS